MRSQRRALLAALLAAAVVGMSACGDSDDSNGSAAAGGSANAETTEKPAKRPRIAVVLHLRVPSLLQFCYGAEQAGKEMGFDVDCVGPQKINTIEQQKIVQSEVNNNGVQGVAPLLIGAEAWRRVIKDMQARGVRWVNIGIQTGKFLGDDTPLLIAPRDVRTGRAAAQIILDNLPPNPKGEVIVAPGVVGLKLCEDRFNGAKQLFAEKAPGIKVLRLNAADDDVKGPTDWQALINSHPKALAFVGDCASTAPAILGKIHAKTKPKWLATGSELDPRTPPYIQSGDVAGVTSASFWVQGYLAGRVLYEQIVNKKYLDYEGWIDSGTQVVDKSNVGDVITALKSKQSLADYYGPKSKEIFTNLKAALGPY